MLELPAKYSSALVFKSRARNDINEPVGGNGMTSPLFGEVLLRCCANNELLKIAATNREPNKLSSVDNLSSSSYVDDYIVRSVGCLRQKNTWSV